MIKKVHRVSVFFVSCMFGFLLLPAHAQSPSDAIYTYIDRWEARGYIDPLYVLRPYSPEVIRSICEQVIEKGSPDDAALAAKFLERYDGWDFSVSILHRSDANVGNHKPVYRGETGVELQFIAKPFKTVWLGSTLDFLLVDGNKLVKPYSERNSIDIHEDGSMNFFPKGLSGDNMGLLYGLSAATWFGPDWLHGSASFSRSSVGPFFDNGIVLGAQAYATPNWALNAKFGKWRLSASMHQLKAANKSFDKYMSFHSYSFAPLPNLDIGVIETVIWSGAWKPLYMLPLSMLFFLQSQAGFRDNSLAGFYIHWRPIDGLTTKLCLFFDDVGFNDLIKFKFDTKIIGAAQIGLAWAPEPVWAQLVSFDYTAVFPYMYAHHFDGANEDNYTHHGDSLGAALQPNSDRFELRAKFAPPVDGLYVDGVIRFMRHGNASEGLAGGGDGTWTDDGWIGGEPTYQPPFNPGTKPKYFRFLSQNVIEMRLQLGAGIRWSTAVGKTRPELGLRYTFETVWNDNVQKGVFTVNNYIGFDAKWSF